MSNVNVGYIAREFCRERLLDSTTGFNARILNTAPAHGWSPFVLSSQNLYLGRIHIADLSKSQNKLNIPCAILSVATSNALGRSAHRITPTVFSGVVAVSIDFFISFGEMELSVDGEAPFFSVEEALINCFNGDDTYATVPAGLSYNNEIQVDQGRLEWMTSTWAQHIAATLVFAVTT